MTVLGLRLPSRAIGTRKRSSPYTRGRKGRPTRKSRIPRKLPKPRPKLPAPTGWAGPVPAPTPLPPAPLLNPKALLGLGVAALLIWAWLNRPRRAGGSPEDALELVPPDLFDFGLEFEGSVAAGPGELTTWTFPGAVVPYWSDAPPGGEVLFFDDQSSWAPVEFYSGQPLRTIPGGEGLPWEQIDVPGSPGVVVVGRRDPDTSALVEFLTFRESDFGEFGEGFYPGYVSFSEGAGAKIRGTPEPGATAVLSFEPTAGLPVAPLPLPESAPATGGERSPRVLAPPVPAGLPGVAPFRDPSTEPPSVPEVPSRPPEILPLSTPAVRPGPSPAVVPGLTPVLPPADPDVAVGPDGATETAAPPASVPTTAPETTVIGGVPVGGPGTAPPPTLPGIAAELGRIEKKLEITLGGGPPPADPDAPRLPSLLDILDLLEDLFDLFEAPQEATTYSLGSPCELDDDGEVLPPYLVPIPPDKGIDAVVYRLDAIAELIQEHKNQRQPICRNTTKIEGREVTVRFDPI